MAKRPDKHDATMPLSESQVVAVNPKPPDHHIPPNDRSVWKGMVVGADEFAPAPAKRRSRAKLWIAAGVLVAGAGGVAAYQFLGRSSTAPAASSAPASGSAVMPAAAAPAIDAMTAPPDAAPADAAPVDAAPADAAVPPDAGAATSAATKPAATKKKVPVKKRPVTKKKH